MSAGGTEVEQTLACLATLFVAGQTGGRGASLVWTPSPLSPVFKPARPHYKSGPRRRLASLTLQFSGPTYDVVG